jgi:ATP-binding cassette, subfamily C, bacterial CydC
VTGTLRRIGALAAPPPGEAALALALGIAAVGCGVGLITAAGYLISRAAEQPPILSLTVTIVAVRFFGLARPVARYVERLVSHDAALRALGQIRARFFERIEPLAPGRLASYRSGDLLSRMVGDVEGLQSLYVRGVGPPLVAVTIGAASVTAVALFSPLAAVVLTAGLLLAGTLVPAVGWAVDRSARRREAAARGELTAELVELLRGAPELVAFGREAEVTARIRRADGDLIGLGRRNALAGGMAEGLSVLVTGLTLAGVLAVAVAEHAAGSLDRVLVATLALLALSAFDAVLPLGAAARELETSVSAGRRVLELTGAEAAIREPDSPMPPPTRHAPVALEGVTVRYDVAEEPVLSGVDLRLEPGARVALVGPSGSGKTTVTNLLLRFLDPESGRVTIAGRDIREYRQEDVRATFALAGQDAHVFDSTIRANLLIGRPGATDGALWDALRRARLDAWVATLPYALETLVGEDGMELSGGQRQRLVLARALLADRPVLLLDEPTAHLDEPTATELVQDVLTTTGDKTVLLITHRPEGLELVDEIIRFG